MLKDSKLNANKIYFEDAPYPLSFIIDVNHKCNYHCKLCLRNFMNDKESQKDFEYFKSVVDRLPFAREISIGALGEPFLIQDFDKMLKYLWIKKIHPTFTTNGSLMTEDKFVFIPYNTTVFVSMEGATQEIYEKNRDGDVELVKNNIRALRAKRPDVSVVINCMLLRTNIFYLNDMIDFCKEVGVALSLFKPIFFSKELANKFSIFTTGITGRDALQNSLAYAQEQKVPISFLSMSMNAHLCHRAFSQPIIAYGGDVFACDYAFQNPNYTNPETEGEWTSYNYEFDVKVPQYEYFVGNILKSKWETIWNSKKYRHIRKTLMQIQQDDKLKFENREFKEIHDHCKSCFSLWGRCL